MLELEVLIGKLLAVDRLATSAVPSREVTALKHEVGNHTVEVRASIAKALLARAKSTEVRGRLWHNIIEELELDCTERGSVLGNVKEDVRHIASRS